MIKIDYFELGQILQNARDSLKLRQSDVAKKIGCTPSNISSWERGKSKIDIDSLATLCELYNLDIIILLERVTLGKVNDYNLTSKEKEHLTKYKQLDFYGKKMVDLVLDIEFERCTESNVLELEENEKTLINQYRKCDDNGKKVISSVLNMASDIDAYRAAMSDDDHVDEIIKMSKAEVDRLMSLPMTDEDL